MSKSPYAMNFRLMCAGIELATFTQLVAVNGMSVPLRLTPSTLDPVLLQPAVRGTTPTVTFARPRSSDTNLFTWFQSAQRGLPGARKNGAIIAHDFNYNTVIGKWNFTNGWPAKWHVEYPAGGDVAMEVVTIAYEHISRG